MRNNCRSRYRTISSEYCCSYHTLR